MKNIMIKSFLLVLTVTVASCCCVGDKSEVKKDYTKYVNTLIGTDRYGHTFPGPAAPFGMVQPGPDTGDTKWEHCVGYDSKETAILFFSQNRLAGGGAMDMGDVSFIPFVGAPKKDSYTSNFKKENEKPNCYLYSVYLDEAKSKVDITATERVAFYRIKFDEDNGGLYFDFQRGLCHDKAARAIEADINLVDPFTITGYQRVRTFASYRNMYFVVKFDKPVVEKIETRVENHVSPKWSLLFDLKKGDSVKVKIALSATGIEGAKKNLEAELNHWDFSLVENTLKEKWNSFFSLVDVEGTADQKACFYTAMYRVFCQPNNMADVDGKYQAPSDKICQSINKDNSYHGMMAFWDTYRAVHPLYTILTPQYVDSFVNSSLMFYEDYGSLPIIVVNGKETYAMIGTHSISVIAEAMMKGFDGFDYDKALKAMVDSSSIKRINENGSPVGNNPDFNLYFLWESYENHPLYEELGYYPFDVLRSESVSRTLEVAYDDYCVAEVAKKMGNKDVYDRFYKRSQSFKNVFDKETNFMRGKDSKGNWREPFDPMLISHIVYHPYDYTEANAWQYTWHVQQDIPALIELMGGKEAFCKKLDELFEMEETADKNEAQQAVDDASGLIGMCAMGNEPCAHVPYLYAMAGEPRKTAHYIREICDTQFFNAPAGLSGNDDQGHLSAWYIFSSMGFYPVNPISGEYILGAPQIESATINLPDRKTFKVIANNLSRENKFVKSVKLNGEEYTKNYITHADILAGGILEFEMCK